jgi:WD40 repeat protein
MFISDREEVFQVEWDPNHETVLASSADDRRLNIWDLNRYFHQTFMNMFEERVI